MAQPDRAMPVRHMQVYEDYVHVCSFLRAGFNRVQNSMMTTRCRREDAYKVVKLATKLNMHQAKRSHDVLLKLNAALVARRADEATALAKNLHRENRRMARLVEIFTLDPNDNARDKYQREEGAPTPPVDPFQVVDITQFLAVLEQEVQNRSIS